MRHDLCHNLDFGFVLQLGPSSASFMMFHDVSFCVESAEVSSVVEKNDTSSVEPLLIQVMGEFDGPEFSRMNARRVAIWQTSNVGLEWNKASNISVDHVPEYLCSINIQSRRSFFGCGGIRG